MIEDRIPPHSEKAEQAVLGSILKHPDAINKIELKPEYFYTTSHRFIFTAMLELKNNEIPIDIVSVFNALEKMKVDENCGGIFYLTELHDCIPTAANIEYHAKIVESNFLLLDFIKYNTNLIQKAYDKPDPYILYDQQTEYILKKNKGNASDENFSDFVTDTIINIRSSDDFGCLYTSSLDLNRLMGGWPKSELSIIAGHTSTGKTSFLIQEVLENLKHDIPCGFLTLEMPKKIMVMRFLSQMSGIPLRKIKFWNLTKEEENKVTHYADELRKYPLRLEMISACDIHDARSYARTWNHKYDIQLFAIDHLQYMAHAGGKDDNRANKVGNSTKGLHALSLELEIAIILLSQLSGRDEGIKPSIHNLRDSGEIGEDARNVLLINRPDRILDPTKSEFILAKQSNGEIGHFDMKFSTERSGFENYTKDIPF